MPLLLLLLLSWLRTPEAVGTAWQGAQIEWDWKDIDGPERFEWSRTRGLSLAGDTSSLVDPGRVLVQRGREWDTGGFQGRGHLMLSGPRAGWLAPKGGGGAETIAVALQRLSSTPEAVCDTPLPRSGSFPTNASVCILWPSAPCHCPSLPSLHGGCSTPHRLPPARTPNWNALS